MNMGRTTVIQFLLEVSQWALRLWADASVAIAVLTYLWNQTPTVGPVGCGNGDYDDDDDDGSSFSWLVQEEGEKSVSSPL